METACSVCGSGLLWRENGGCAVLLREISSLGGLSWLSEGDSPADAAAGSGHTGGEASPRGQ